MHAAHLALARWRSGYCQCEMLSGSPQSRWHAAAQDNFAGWLAAGGFSQAEPESGGAPAGASGPGEPEPEAAPPRWRELTLPGTLAGHCTGACAV